MSNNPRFEDALDACIADIVADRRSVAECLAAWPQFRHELAPLLGAASAMDAAPRVAEHAPDPVRRAEFMALIRSTPQQSPHRGVFHALGRIFAMPRLALPAGVQRATFAVSAAAVLAIAALAGTLLLGQGTTTAYASTVTVFAGTVEQQVDGQWVAMPDGATLSEGVRLRTGDDGSAVLTFTDGSTVGIEANTELLIEFVSFGVARQISLRQFSGSLWNDVVPDMSPGSFYTVRTPDAVVSARGTLFSTNVGDGVTTIDTFDGLVEVAAGDETTFVTPGEFASARAHQQVIPAQAREDSSQLALSVSAPFAASLVAPDGKATGVRQDGVAFNQISGAATSHPSDGEQQLELQRPAPGIYRLLLSRTGEGDGEIVLRFGDQLIRLSISASDDAVGVDLRVSIDADGKLSVEAVNMRSIEAREAEEGGARVVVTEAAERRATPAARRDRDDDDDDGDDDRPSSSGRGRDGTIGTTDATDDGDDDGDDSRGRGKSLQEQARDRLQSLLDDADDELAQQLDDATKQKLQQRLLALDDREAEREQERERRDAEREGRSADSDDDDGDDGRDGSSDNSGRGNSNPSRSSDADDGDSDDNDAGNGANDNGADRRGSNSRDSDDDERSGNSGRDRDDDGDDDDGRDDSSDNSGRGNSNPSRSSDADNGDAGDGSNDDGAERRDSDSRDSDDGDSDDDERSGNSGRDRDDDGDDDDGRSGNSDQGRSSDRDDDEDDDSDRRSSRSGGDDDPSNRNSGSSSDDDDGDDSDSNRGPPDGGNSGPSAESGREEPSDRGGDAADDGSDDDDGDSSGNSSGSGSGSRN